MVNPILFKIFVTSTHTTMNRINAIRLTAILALLVCAVAVQAQRRNARYVEYIEKYAPLAVQQMKEHKIPASITLAQGLLESGAGQSTLARKSNNHFGIKCGSNWRGRTVRHDDDARNECFRAYSNPRDSYEDHSAFLKRGARYAFLFDLKITDYKGWARGLKKAGYATDPSYANRLITIIEDYDLYKYDSRGMSKREARKWEKELKKKPWLANPHQVYIANDIAYVVARDGDTFRFLGGEFDISWKKLVKYNDLHKDYTLEAGDIIYLKAKKKKASKPHTVYIVRDGGKFVARILHFPQAFDKVKVVIIGQDPYHGPGQAHGLCFSVNDGVRFPPSLINIFKEIKDDIGTDAPTTGNLTRWAEQGVLLLNATLTVRAHQAGSHQNKGWETFTDAAIRALAEQREHLVFILWGSYAQRKGAFIDRNKHLVQSSAHPSPLSAYNGFFGNKHFSRTNDYLREHGEQEIIW